MDVQPESGKPDMIRRLKLVHEITGMVNFYGKGISLYVIYNGDESRSRTIELISRITNAEKITQSRMPMPHNLTRNLTASDVAIIRALSKDARKSTLLVAKELGLSTKTVSKRMDRLRRENTILPLPILNIASIPGIIPIYLTYMFSNSDVKTSVDREMISHFDARAHNGKFRNPRSAALWLGDSQWQKFQRSWSGRRHNRELLLHAWTSPRRLLCSRRS